MVSRFVSASSLAGLILAAVVPAARGDFALVSQDLTINHQADAVHFALTFNQVPDFQTVDGDGRPADSFQVEFDGTSTLPNDLTAVVRGDEIHLAGAVRVRTPTGDGGPAGGGWGPVVGTVPYSLTGNTVAFTVPGSTLGWTGGAWAASTFSLDYGSLTAQQTATSVPAPPAFWGGLAGLAVIAGLSGYRAVNRRRSPGYLARVG